MLGVMLPVLSNEWGLHDDAAGFLFFSQFLGSSLGAVITGANHVRWLTIGYGLLAVSACVLAFCGMPFLFPAFFCFGLGLGIAMTSTSLVFSDRYREDCAAQLQRLNFAWAVGATTAPILLLPYFEMTTLRALFFSFLALFAGLFAWVFLKERQEAPERRPAMDGSLPPGIVARGSLAPLVVLAICAVGIEASLSGWLTTYARRADPSHLAEDTLALSLFWLGITSSRLVFSTRVLAMIGSQRTLRVGALVLTAAVIMLIGVHTPAAIRIGSALAGLSLGPLYPLLLSFMLEFTERGWIFAVGGAGATFFPWFTGLLSAHYGSLRYGLIAPCGAALLMVTLVSVNSKRAYSQALATTP